MKTTTAKPRSGARTKQLFDTLKSRPNGIAKTEAMALVGTAQLRVLLDHEHLTEFEMIFQKSGFGRSGNTRTYVKAGPVPWTPRYSSDGQVTHVKGEAFRKRYIDYMGEK